MDFMIAETPHRTREASDWLPPIIATDLRRDTRAIVKIVLIVHVALMFSTVGALVAAIYEMPDRLEGFSTLFWVFICVPMLGLLPAGGAQALPKDNKLELLYLTRLKPWGIVASDCFTGFFWSIFLALSALPYLVLHSLLGGFDVVNDLRWLGLLLVFSTVLTSITIGFSVNTTKSFRLGFLLLLLFGLGAGINVFLIIGPGSVATWVRAGGVYGNLFVLLIYVPLVILLMIEIGASKIAPAAENRSYQLRGLGILFLALAWVLEMAGNGSGFSHALAGAALLIICVFSLCENPRRIRGIEDRYTRRGRRGRIERLLFFPGWRSAAIYTTIMATLFSALVLKGTDAGDGVKLALLLIYSSLIFPVALTRFFRPETDSGLVWFFCIQIGMLLVAILAYTLYRTGFVEAVALASFLPASFALLLMTGALPLDEYGFYAIVTAATILLSLAVLLVRGLSRTSASVQVPAVSEESALSPKNGDAHPAFYGISDGLSPFIVKELRQGMRGRVFLWSFLFTQAAMMFCAFGMLMAVSASSAGQLDFFSLLFWIVIGAPLLIVIPTIGNNTLWTEFQTKNLELVCLTHLTPWRIVAGKWAALFAQSLLFCFAVLPYLVLRYFLGGIDLINELIVLFGLLILCAILTAVAVSSSPYGGPVLSWSIVVLVGVCIALPAADYISSSAGTGQNPFILALVFVPLTLLLIFEMGSSKLAPPGDNRAFHRRALGLLFLLAAGSLEMVGTQNWFPLALGAVPLLLICIVSLCESPRWIRGIYVPYTRRGWIGRAAGRLFFYPGWPSGVIYTTIVMASFSGLIIKRAGPGDGLTLFLLVFYSSLIFPVAVTRLFRPATASAFAWFCGVTFGLLFINFLGALLVETGSIEATGLIKFLPISLLLGWGMIPASDYAFLTAATAAIIVISLAVLFIRGLPMISRFREMERPEHPNVAGNRTHRAKARCYGMPVRSIGPSPDDRPAKVEPTTSETK